MTTKFNSPVHGGLDAQSYLTPALGDSWGHVPQNRIVLFWDADIDGSVRCALLSKSATGHERKVKYCVTPDGIRDCADEEAFNPAETAASERGVKRRYEEP